MSGSSLYWILVFTASSLEHLAERDIDEVDVANAVFGAYGAVFVRRTGSGRDLRWLIIAPLEDEELLSCVLRAAEPRDLEAEGAFVVPATGIPEEPNGVLIRHEIVCQRPNVGAG